MTKLEEIKERVQLANYAVNNRIAGIEEQEEHENAELDAVEYLMKVDGMCYDDAYETVLQWELETEEVPWLVYLAGLAPKWKEVVA